jgi:MFS family permease
MVGRFFWASTSDFIGRKATYFCFFILGPILYFFMPFTGYNHVNSVVLFVSIACVAISMYGGGFATVPAYLKDLFGGYNVSAIHGRLLTAWSVAGIVGPLIVNGILDHYKAAGLNRMDGYRVVLHIMVGLLVVGFIANLMIRPVANRFWVKDAPATKPTTAAH